MGLPNYDTKKGICILVTVKLQKKGAIRWQIFTEYTFVNEMEYSLLIDISFL